MMGLMMRPSRKMFASSWFSSSKVSGGILPWNSGSTLSADKFIIKPSFLRVGRFGGCGLDVVVKPKAGLAVGAGFLDGLAGVCAAAGNALEECSGARDNEAIKAALRQHGAVTALMTGSGAAVFGVFPTEEAARGAAEALKAQWPQVYVAQPDKGGARVVSPKWLL